MNELKVQSTSRVSAQVSDIVLRETGVTRLVFRPLLVDNTKDPAAAVKGTFVFRRKSPKATWKDATAKPLSSLHMNEGYQLALDSAETLALYNHLADLYKLYQVEGIPPGERAYVRTSAMTALTKLSDTELNVFLDANENLGSELTTRLLLWATSAHDAPQLVSVLELLGPEGLGNLDTAVSLRAIAEALSLWNENRENEAKNSGRNCSPSARSCLSNSSLGLARSLPRRHMSEARRFRILAAA